MTHGAQVSNSNYEFDVAFSFHSMDEGLATQLNDLVQDRFNTFLYSRQQEMLAGTDGEETFNSVFGKRSRCVVVFCRKEWGETPFTRIEQTAIRNRAFDEGYEFTIFIPTDKPPAVPPWLPRTRLYFGLDRFGLQGAAAVIEQRIQALGGEPRVESINDHAARLQRKRDLDQARKTFRNSPEGIRAANEAWSALTSALQARAADIAEANPSFAQLKVRRFSDYWLISGTEFCIVIRWRPRYRNSLDEALLTAELYRGVPRLPGLVPDIEEPTRLLRKIFEYRLLRDHLHGYVPIGDEGRAFSPDELADSLLRVYLDTVDKSNAG